MSRPRVVLLRGHSANPWELGAWEPLRDRFDITVAVTRHNLFDVSSLELASVRAKTLRDWLPPGRVGDLAVHLPGDRYRDPARFLEGADIVHSVEIGTWFARQPAELKRRLGFRLVLTVWGTIPYLDHLLDPLRARHWRRERQLPIHEADLLLATTERARRCLLLDGADPDRVEVAWPGVDVDRFAAARDRAPTPDRHLVVSPGRLVWEKGHHDVLRALAAIGGDHRLQIVGSGPQRERLLRYARDLGVADRVEIGAVPYERMPEVFASASVVVLASLARRSGRSSSGWCWPRRWPRARRFSPPRRVRSPRCSTGRTRSCSARATGSGWRSPGRSPRGTAGARAEHPDWLVERYSTAAAAERLAAAYERVLA